MIEWNKVKYIDCMDEKEGLPSLPDKSIDLGFADPPYNLKYKGQKGNCVGPEGSNKNLILYEDEKSPEVYKEWCFNWFSQLERVCRKIIITPGLRNLNMWYAFSNPLDIFIHYKKNGMYGGRVSLFNNMDIYLYFGNTFKKPPLINNVIQATVQWGFLKKRLQSNQQNLIHPCPRNYEIMFLVLSSFNPKSVIDPFMGSGTTAEVCTKLGIKWIGYEINNVYSQDINKRLKNCKKQPQQIKLKL